MLFRCATHAPAADHGHGHTVTNGKKYFTVDIHCHIHVPAADAQLRELTPDVGPGTVIDSNPMTAEINRQLQQTILPQLTDPAVRLADMDRQGIDVQAISSSPFHYNYAYPAEVGRATCRTVNDRLAEVVGGHPERFVGLGLVPLQDPDMAVVEFDRCIDELGFKGIEISTNVNGRELTRAGLEKLFARVEERDALIFMHPIGTSYQERMDDHYFRNLIGHPVESALAVGHLVFDGYLKRYPGLKICIAHGGGYAPAYVGRFDHPYHLRDDCRVNIDQPPSEYMKKLYFDSVVFTEHQLRYLIETWGPDHIVVGTDYPYDMAEPDPVGHVNSVQGLNDEAKAQVMGGNAAKLLNIAVPVTN